MQAERLKRFLFLDVVRCVKQTQNIHLKYINEYRKENFMWLGGGTLLLESIQSMGVQQRSQPLGVL